MKLLNEGKEIMAWTKNTQNCPVIRAWDYSIFESIGETFYDSVSEEYRDMATGDWIMDREEVFSSFLDILEDLKIFDPNTNYRDMIPDDLRDLEYVIYDLYYKPEPTSKRKLKLSPCNRVSMVFGVVFLAVVVFGVALHLIPSLF